MWIYVFWSCICVFLYMCICVFAILDTHNYHLWGPVLSRNHCRQTFILYIRVYMPFADCTLLRSRGGGPYSWRYMLPAFKHKYSLHVQRLCDEGTNPKVNKMLCSNDQVDIKHLSLTQIFSIDLIHFAFSLFW